MTLPGPDQTTPRWLYDLQPALPSPTGMGFGGPKPLGIDVETTGLDPVNDHMLEFAAVLLDRDLNYVNSFGSRVLSATEIQLDRMSPFVRDMHTRSGLLDEVRASTLTIGELEEEVGEWLVDRGYAGNRDRRRTDLIILGSSCRLDLYMVEMKMPRLASMLSHRMIDVSGHREAMSMWAPDFVPEWPKPGAGHFPAVRTTAHRALSDTFDTIAEARELRILVASAQPGL